MGGFPDGTRFTYDGVERLLSDFEEAWIQPCGGPVSVFLDSLFRYGYRLRSADVEEYETKLRYLLFRDLFSSYERKHERAINGVGYRFFAKV